MKIPRLNQHNTPAALLVWLKEELNSRGIDGAIYNRYILSVLQDEEEEEDEQLIGIGVKREKGSGCCCLFETPFKSHHQCARENMKSSGKWLPKRARTNNGNSVGNVVALAHQCGHCCNEMGYQINSNEGKKLAVIEILKGASEQEYGIESFVDELCDKLGNLKKNRTLSLNMEEQDHADNFDEENDSCKNENPTGSPLEQAKKYFAAFPALGCCSGDGDGVGMNLVNRYRKREDKVGDKMWDGRKIAKVSQEKNEDENDVDDGIEADDCLEDSSIQQTTTATNLSSTYISQSTTNSSTGIRLDYFNVFEKNKPRIVNQNDYDDGKMKGREYGVKNIDNNVSQPQQPILVNVDIQMNATQPDDDFDPLQQLADKFNSNIASIWTTEQSNESQTQHMINDNVNKGNNNIWSFDSSFSSPQSSTNSSPINTSKLLDVDLIKKIWKKNVNEEFAMPCMKHEIWEPLDMMMREQDAGHAHQHIFSQDLQLASERSIKRSLKKKLRNTLLNHQKDSLFVEFSPKREKKGDNVLTASSSACIQSKNFFSNDDLPGEDLLVSSKTHFQPIKQESIERDLSDDGSVIDDEVSGLVVCSSKCPNNYSSNSDSEKEPTHVMPRPVSTSFVELASFMGPFNDDNVTHCLIENEEEQYPENLILDAKHLDDCRDKSTSTDDAVGGTCSDAVVENEFEPEYQDLCNMINEVLKDGLNEESNVFINKGLSSLDWCDEDKDGSWVPGNRKAKEHRLSWSCYWDTFDVDKGQNYNTEQEDYNGELKVSDEQIYQEDTFFYHGNPSSTQTHLKFDAIVENVMSDEFNMEGNNEYNDWYPDFYDESNQQATDNSSYNETTLLETNDGILDDGNQEGYWIDLQNDGTSISPFSIDMMKHANSEVCHVARKPCSFFLEGNCKRSDCKFSHDLANIVCKFWREGFCYKHESCPFKHGYDVNEGVSQRRVKSRSYLNTFATSLSNPAYTIGSESDFPSLAHVSCAAESENEHEHEFGHHFESDESHCVFESESNNKTHTSMNEASSGKLPLVVFVKKKAKKRKDRNLQ